MFFPSVSLFLLFFIIFSLNSFSSPRENWYYGKKGKEIKHHTENIRVRDLTKKSEDSSDNKTINSKEEKIYKPGTPRDRY